MSTRDASLSLFPYFEDLVHDEYNEVFFEGSVEDELTLKDEANLDDPSVVLIDSQSLSLQEILDQLQVRGIVSYGFFAEDSKLLQEAIDEEYRQHREAKCREYEQTKEQRLAQANERRRQKIIDLELERERRVLEDDSQLKHTLRQIVTGKGAAIIRVDTSRTNLVARPLAFALCSTECNICSLDLSQTGMSDSVGAYLCRALGRNYSIRRLDLGNNEIGPRALCVLADSLSDSNRTVEFVCLQGNPLVGRGGNYSGIKALAAMLGKNSVLKHLGLFRCMIGMGAGDALADAVEKNISLCCMKIGYNLFSNFTIKRIRQKTQTNRHRRQVERKERARQKYLEESRRTELAQLMAAQRKEVSDLNWLEEQKRTRADERRLSLERRLEQERLERHSEEGRRLKEEEKEATAVKKARKKKGKGKKKRK